MIFDIDKTQDGEWFAFFESSQNKKGKITYHDPKPEEKTRVCIRSINPVFEKQISERKKKYEHVLNPETGKMERIGFYEDLTAEQAKEQNNDVWDHAIVDWQQITDKTGKEIPCTRENKLKLMEIPAFDRFVARCLEILQDATTNAQAAEAKN